MNQKGLALASRFSYPPNSFSLCGPEKQRDLAWYSQTLQTDTGTAEILSQFATLYPYLALIAAENKIADPFDPRVVEAYWIGNSLLYKVSITKFMDHLMENLSLSKKIKLSEKDLLVKKATMGALPFHAFHVCNIYKRTGNMNIPHTTETMNACVINWGKVINISLGKLMISTRPLGFGKKIQTTILTQGKDDVLAKRLKAGDYISYHWGYFCTKLTSLQLRNLVYFTNLALEFAGL